MKLHAQAKMGTKGRGRGAIWGWMQVDDVPCSEAVAELKVCKAFVQSNKVTLVFEVESSSVLENLE